MVPSPTRNRVPVPTKVLPPETLPAKDGPSLVFRSGAPG
jgi:hypothetical protein